MFYSLAQRFESRPVAVYGVAAHSGPQMWHLGCCEIEMVDSLSCNNAALARLWCCTAQELGERHPKPAVHKYDVPAEALEVILRGAVLGRMEAPRNHITLQLSAGCSV